MTTLYDKMEIKRWSIRQEKTRNALSCMDAPLYSGIVTCILRDLLALWAGSVVRHNRSACTMRRGEAYNFSSVLVGPVFVKTAGNAVSFRAPRFSSCLVFQSAKNVPFSTCCPAWWQGRGAIGAQNSVQTVETSCKELEST